MQFRICSLLALASVALHSPLAAADAMPEAQQTKLIHDYCAVCHTDASRNGGLTLQHFDAANPDPGVARMLVSKIHGGAFGA